MKYLIIQNDLGATWAISVEESADGYLRPAGEFAVRDVDIHEDGSQTLVMSFGLTSADVSAGDEVAEETKDSSAQTATS